MKIYNVTDPEFKPYGQIVEGMDEVVAKLVDALAKTDMPAEGAAELQVWYCVSCSSFPRWVVV